MNRLSRSLWEAGSRESRLLQQGHNGQQPRARSTSSAIRSAATAPEASRPLGVGHHTGRDFGAKPVRVAGRNCPKGEDAGHGCTSLPQVGSSPARTVGIREPLRLGDRSRGFVRPVFRRRCVAGAGALFLVSLSLSPMGRRVQRRGVPFVRTHRGKAAEGWP